MSSQKGRYDRSGGAGQRPTWHVKVSGHMDALRRGALLVSGECSVSSKYDEACVNGGRCHAHFTIADLEHAACCSFGDGIFDAVINEDWNSITSNHQANVKWFEKLVSFRTTDENGIRVCCKLNERPICFKRWAHYHGIASATRDAMARKLWSGECEWNNSSTRELQCTARNMHADLTHSATQWWYTRLQYYEMRTKEGLIVHPRGVLWKSVYDDEFVPFMQLCGHDWKKSDAKKDDDGVGSEATWYSGRAAALVQLAKEKLDADSQTTTFVLKSRAKHSAYKECHQCQTGRLAIQQAIKDRQPPHIIRGLQEDAATHLRWMYAQRFWVERLSQQYMHERKIVENSDKCGDGCIHLPGHGGRASSANTGNWQYKVSLQANVYSGLLYHLTLLLPNLSTGANFGITSFITGLCRMIDHGEITPTKRDIFRGFDGDSANVCKVGLAFNCVLAKEARFNVQQHRLPPDHSHVWQTDGFFSVLEGWLSHPSFGGCRTLSHLVTFLRSKFATSDKYKDQRMEISILIANFAFTKWLDDCIEASTLTHIGVPLVWRHWWNDGEQRVISQYKMTLATDSTPEKDEWGPWVDTWIDVPDQTTGQLTRKKVLRSDPNGVNIMRRYPNVNIDPGLEEWLSGAEPSAEEGTRGWSLERVMRDVKKTKYTGCEAADAANSLREWQELHRWHLTYPSVEDIRLTAPIALPSVPSEILNTTPSLTWAAMWAKLKSVHNPGTMPVPDPHALMPAPAPPIQPRAGRTATIAALDDLRHPNREALENGDSAAICNVVGHSGADDTARRAALDADDSVGADYVDRNWDVVGTPFLIRLENFEGEFRVGLGVRTHDASADQPADSKFQVRWYKRPPGAGHSWGKSPSFSWDIGGYDGRRKPLPSLSLEHRSDFLPLRVLQTDKSTAERPRLKERTLDALRRVHPELRRERPLALEAAPVAHGAHAHQTGQP